MAFLLHINHWFGGPILIYTSNKPKSALAQELGDCCDNKRKNSKYNVQLSKK